MGSANSPADTSFKKHSTDIFINIKELKYSNVQIAVYSGKAMSVILHESLFPSFSIISILYSNPPSPLSSGGKTRSRDIVSLSYIGRGNTLNYKPENQ